MKHRKAVTAVACLIVLALICTGVWTFRFRSSAHSYANVGTGYVERALTAYFRMFNRYPADLTEPDFQRVFAEKQNLVIEKAEGSPQMYVVASGKAERARRTYFIYRYQGGNAPPIVEWAPPPPDKSGEDE